MISVSSFSLQMDNLFSIVVSCSYSWHIKTLVYYSFHSWIIDDLVVLYDLSARKPSQVLAIANAQIQQQLQ